MSTSLRLACINIERDNHLERVSAFLREMKPDIVCLQELLDKDIAFFAGLMGQEVAFAPMTRRADGHTVGLGMVGRLPLHQVASPYYKGDPAQTPEYKRTGAGAFERPDTETLNHPLLCATVEGFRISTTHLTWTVHGESTAEQLHDVDNLLRVAATEAAEHGGLVMCGDFNAPRGRPTFGKIAERFTDAIPAHYQGSLDLNLHRVTKENPPEAERMKTLMVDGLFHTPNYTAADVTLHSGVSDHMAITATLTKV